MTRPLAALLALVAAALASGYAALATRSSPAPLIALTGLCLPAFAWCLWADRPGVRRG
mgnify:CR=1 FL=1